MGHLTTRTGFRHKLQVVFSVWGGMILMGALLFSVLPAWTATVDVAVIHSQDKYPAGGSYPVIIKVRIQKDVYLHGPHAGQDGMIPTSLSFSASPHLQVADISFPLPVWKTFSYAKEPVAVFSDEIQVHGVLTVNPGAPSGKLTQEGLFSFQACTAHSCMPPEDVVVPLELSITPQGSEVTFLNKEAFQVPQDAAVPDLGFPGVGFGTGIWLTLLGIFLGGMALNLTPCIYPLIPITVSYFGGMSDQFKGKTIVHGIMYILGLSITNSALGLTASLTGSMVGRIIQEPAVVIGVASILVLLATSFFGLWEFRLPSGLMRVSSKTYGGYFGTFFMGLTLGIVAAPCLGPFILALLAHVAQQGDPFYGFICFFVLSVGMGLPLAVLAVFSGALTKLPLSGGWLLWIRKLLGWVLVAMAGYMLKTIIGSDAARMALGAAIMVAAGLHLGWLDREKGVSRTFVRIRRALGTLLIFLGVVFLQTDHKIGVKWTPYDPAGMALAAEKKIPVILDFYADWCVPCQNMDEEVFTDPDVLAMSKLFGMMRVDLTQKHQMQNELLKKYHVKGVPTILFINHEGKIQEALSIETYVDKDVILDRMRRLLTSCE